MTEKAFNNLTLERQKAEMMSFVLKKGFRIILGVKSNTQATIVVEKRDGFPRAGKQIYNIGKRRKPTEPKWEKAIEDGYKFYYENIRNGKIKTD